MYTIELIWNREFNFRAYGGCHFVKEDAIKLAEAIYNSGDGARVKEIRVVNEEGEVVWRPHYGTSL